MAKEQIKNLIEDSKTQLDQTYDSFVKSVKDELASFKKKTLDQI